MKKPNSTSTPSEDMLNVLAWLAKQDSGLPDPTTLAPAEGRALASESNKRWNQDLPPMRQTDSFVFKGFQSQPIEASLFTPEIVDNGLIVFIHGGGFAFCNVGTHERCARLLANEARCSVLSVEYRLAPEHPYPAGLNDCIAVFRQLARLHSIFPWTNGFTCVAGDSAGANLALALILHEQFAEHRAPDAALLFYGVFSADFDTPSYLEFKNGPGLTRAKMMRYMDWYVDASERNDPMAVPLLASDEMLMKLPPLYFNAAQIDPLCSDTVSLVDRLRVLGRQDQLQMVSGVVHGFMQMSLRLPAACKAIADAGTAYRQFADHPDLSSIT